MRYGDVFSLREKNVILSESEAGYFSIKEKKTEDKILITIVQKNLIQKNSSKIQKD